MNSIPLLVLSLLCVGCAAKKMATRNADVLIEYQIEKRLPLYSSQKQDLSKDVKVFLNSQKDFVKKHLTAINQIQLDPLKVDEQYQQFQAIYKHLALEFSRLMSLYMALLDSKQQKDFFEKLAAENRQLKSITSDDRAQKVVSRIDLLFGSVSDEQKKLIKEKMPHFEGGQKTRITRREGLEKEFLKIYKQDLSKEARASAFYDAFSWYQDSYQEDSINKEFIKSLLLTLDDKQKSVFKKKLNELEEIIKLYIENQY